MNTTQNKMVKELNDDELVDMFKQGSNEAFTELYNRYKAYVFTGSLSVTRNKEKSEDITQEVFMSFIDRIEEYKPQGRLKGYFITASRNRSLDWIEKEHGHYEKLKSMKLDLVTKLGDTEPKDVSGGLAKLNRALSELPDEQREVILFKTYHDMTFQEIADLQHCPLSTVLSRHQYALESLKKKIIQEANDDRE
jgi:RNA polymerase sigma factor (sigma-70 family)